MDPFSSFDLFRRRVDQMFADFDQQMFGGVDPFDAPFFTQRRLMQPSMGPGPLPTVGHEKSTSLSSSTSPPKEDQERVIPHQPEPQPSQSQSQSLMTRPSTTLGIFGSGFPAPTVLSSMKMDLVEDKDRFLVHADVPGFNKDQLQVSVKDGLLTVSGKTSSSKEEHDPDRKYHRVERSSGSMTRSIRLPEQVKEDEISATCENGVLKLVLPKDPVKEKKEREIRVQ